MTTRAPAVLKIPCFLDYSHKYKPFKSGPSPPLNDNKICKLRVACVPALSFSPFIFHFQSSIILMINDMYEDGRYSLLKFDLLPMHNQKRERWYCVCGKSSYGFDFYCTIWKPCQFFNGSPIASLQLPVLG